MKAFLRQSMVSISIAFVLAGCETTSQKQEKLSMASISVSHPLKSPIMKEGIKQLKKGDLEVAAKMFRMQIKVAPRHSLAHFFNAYIYQLMARNGDDQYLDMAQVGYALAAKFDPSSSIVHYYKGTVELNKKNYAQAQGSFSAAFLLDPKSSKALYGLAVSSYYLHDLIVAVGAIEKAVEKNAKNPLYLRTAAIVMAAANKKKKSQGYLNRLVALKGNYSKDIGYIKNRISTWGDIYQVVQSKIDSGLNTASDVPKSAKKDIGKISEKPLKSINSKKNTGKKETKKPPLSVSNYRVPDIENPYKNRNATVAADLLKGPVTQEIVTYASQPKPLTFKGQMVLIDLVIMIAEESSSQAYGMNLLEGLTISLSESPAAAQGLFSWGQSISKQTGNKTITGGNSFTVSNATAYSLNIANVIGERNEIIARPTLTTLSGKQATFSSGNDIVVATSGNGDNSVAGPYNLGLNMIVTPTLLGDGRVSIDIQANRKTVNDSSAPSGSNFSQSLYSGHTQITSTVEMNIGDTLILGGLSQRSDSKSTSAFPVLGDIPGLQYFFQKDTTTQSRKSVIFLITPRQPDYTYVGAIGGPDAAKNSPIVQALFEFKNRYTDWFKPDPNISEAFKHFQKVGVYREFRNGDAIVESWSDLPAILDEVYDSANSAS